MNTVRYSNVSSFLRLNFVVLSLGVQSERVCQRGLPLGFTQNECVKDGHASVESANLTSNLQ